MVGSFAYHRSDSSMNTFARLLSFALILVALTGCGNSDTSDERAVRTVRFWQFWSDPAQRAALDTLLREFERTNDCTVEVTNLLWNDGKAKLQAAFNSGAPPDVIELGSDWIAQFSSAGVLLELPSDSAGIARFVPYTLSPAMWNRKAFAYPWTIDTRVMFVNTELAARSGASASVKTFSELLTSARAVQRSGTAGIGMNGADRHRLYKKILPMLWTYGGDVFDANGQPALNSSQNVAAVTMYADLARSGIVETQRQLDAMFLQGQTGFWNSGSWMLSKLAATTKLRYAIVPMPGIDGRPGVSFAGGEYLAVSKKAGNRDLARKLVAFLTHGEQSIRFCSQVAEAGFPADKNFVGHESLTRDPLRAAFAQQLQSARMTPVHPKWLDIEEVLEDAVVRVIYGERSPKQALDEAQQEVRRIVNAP